jgi:hypothetical protein
MSQEEVNTGNLSEWDYGCLTGKNGLFFIMTIADYHLSRSIMHCAMWKVESENIVLSMFQQKVDLQYLDINSYKTYDPDRTVKIWSHNYDLDTIVAPPPGTILLVLVAEAGYVLATLHLLKVGFQLDEDFMSIYREKLNPSESDKMLKTIQEARDMLRKQRMKGDMRKM